MLNLNRRTFVQLSSGAALGVAANRVFALADAPAISNHAGLLRVKGSNYSWEYSQSDEHSSCGTRKISSLSAEGCSRRSSWLRPASPRSGNARREDLLHFALRRVA